MSEVSAARVRISRVVFKAGGEVRVLKRPADEMRVKCLRDIRACLDHDWDFNLAGFAFVVWDYDGASSSAQAGSNSIPGALVPDFVRNRLLAAVAEKWAVSDVAETWGAPPDTSET